MAVCCCAEANTPMLAAKPTGASITIRFPIRGRKSHRLRAGRKSETPHAWFFPTADSCSAPFLTPAPQSGSGDRNLDRRTQQVRSTWNRRDMDADARQHRAVREMLEPSGQRKVCLAEQRLDQHGKRSARSCG